MNQFNLGQFLNRVVDYSLANLRGKSTESAPKSPPSAENFNQNLAPKPPQNPVIIVNTVRLNAMPMQNLRMNHLENLETALYVKDLMKLPKDMKELLTFIQKNIETTPETAKLLTTNIDLNQISLLLQKNGKEAVNKLVMAMSEAAKQGITDLSEIKDTMKLINASISAAGDKNPAATLKSLMLLYLPWLPLQESVGFDLEIEESQGGAEDSESSLTIMISTKNYGNIRATLVLTDGNNVSVFINCSETFPKEELLKRIKSEDKKHSLQSNIVFEQKAMKQDENTTLQAKISMSNSKEISPFLLLMAHSVIKHTIEMDRLAV